MATVNGDYQSCDVLVVGAGTAGCVLANRLSEDPNISVTVIEAGEDRSFDERVYTPGLATQVLDNPEFDWQFTTTPQPGIDGKQLKHPRGKLVGGSSAINSFCLVYPSKSDIDSWAALGNDGWDWQTMEPYFSKFQTIYKPAEKLARELAIIDIPTKGEGPVHGTYLQNASHHLKAWIETFRGLDLVNTEDERYGAALGAFVPTMHITSDQRERNHAGVAYYAPVRDRSNLQLVTGSLVDRIVFERSADEKAVATSVTYVKSGVRHYIRARKEVLLAAGAFGTPQLLELSGIGSGKRLQQHGIEVIYDNPNVGENLQDHLKAGLSYEPAIESALVSPAEARQLYEDSRTGPWAGGGIGFAYLPLERFLSPSEKSELSKALSENASGSRLTAFEKQRTAFIEWLTLSPDEASSVAYLTSKPALPETEGRKWLTLFAMLSHPLSRGSVHITSADVAVKPEIDFGYGSNPLDIEILARHLQVLEQLASRAPLSDFLKRDGRRLPPNVDAQTLDRAKEAVKASAATNYHPCGTCSMMAVEMGGVVDSRLRVYGTSNVRVVDASIMPLIPRGNIITAVYSVAERAADIISEDLGIRRTT